MLKQTIAELTNIPIKDNLNPDRIVAEGAALCSELMAQGKAIQEILSDVTPLTLGTEVYSGEFSPIIPANSAIPCRFNNKYTTVNDYQGEVEVNVYQGERVLADKNILLGTFKLKNIQSARAGIPTLEIEYEIDMNGILHAKCRDKVTKAEKEVRIANSNTLSKQRVEELKKLARLHRSEDERSIKR